MIKTPVHRHSTVNRVVRQPDTLSATTQHSPEADHTGRLHYLASCEWPRLEGLEHYQSRVRIRSSQYLNNVVEQDHRRIKQRIRPMLGFKRFKTAPVTIRGIELAQKIKKYQFNLRPLTKKAVTIPALGTGYLAP